MKHPRHKKIETSAAVPRTPNAVRDIFVPVPATYEKINQILTLGLDRHWRRSATRRALHHNPAKALDLATGTGDMAASLVNLGNSGLAVTAVDFSEPMLVEARRKNKLGKINYLLADVVELPLPDNEFDVATVSFALRNLNLSKKRLLQCFTEFHRVLRDGGRLVTVETTQPRSRLMRWILHSYARMIVPWLGARLSGARPPYAYLGATIPRFYNAPELAAIMRDAGFQNVEFKYLTGGIVAVHEAVK